MKPIMITAKDMNFTFCDLFEHQHECFLIFQLIKTNLKHQIRLLAIIEMEISWNGFNVYMNSARTWRKS